MARQAVSLTRAPDRVLYGARAGAVGHGASTPVASAAANRRRSKRTWPSATRSPSGYTAQKFNENYPNEAPSYFETGYVNTVAKDLQKRRAHKASSSSTTAARERLSAGLIGENEAIGGKKHDAEHKPCAYHFTNGLPLHNSLATLLAA